MGTLLDAINTVITATGTLPVNSPTSQHPSVLLAKNIIERINKSIQAIGWWFNRQYFTVTPDTAGYVSVPTSVLVCDAISSEFYCVQKGSKLYDMTNNTFIFDTTSEIPVQYTFEVDFEDLPYTAYNYIQLYAKHKFLVDKNGDKDKIKSAHEEMTTAWATLQKAQLSIVDPNILQSPNVAKMLTAVRGMKTYGVTRNNLQFGS